MTIDINAAIENLYRYALSKNLIEKEDRYYFINSVLTILDLDDFQEVSLESSEFSLENILKDILTWAVENKRIGDSIVEKDLFDTKIMGVLTAKPSDINRKFYEIYENCGSSSATNWFYQYCKDIDYIRAYRVKKDLVWKTNSEYGAIDITINLSKPEKDPKAIAAMKSAVQSSYPKCQLCKENVGYRGRLNHPARENLRIIPLTLDQDDFYFQYSPYSYYNEHCIVFNSKHTPMAINDKCFRHLLDFVSQFPDYMLGSNADLPIVGGSILTHDHYQGGRYVFPMFLAKESASFEFPGFHDVKATTLYWPLSVIRLRSENKESIISLADKILDSWRNYTDEECFIYAYTDSIPHNTITPICHKEGKEFVLDLTLRNNITTKEHPLGLYHPHEQYWNIKKENIGLIEVMGRAVLPSRLKKELSAVKMHLLENTSLLGDALSEKHDAWVSTFRDKYQFTEDNADSILENEVGKIFVKVLECAGVYKQDENGQKGLYRFIHSVC